MSGGLGEQRRLGLLSTLCVERLALYPDQLAQMETMRTQESQEHQGEGRASQS